MEENAYLVEHPVKQVISGAGSCKKVLFPGYGCLVSDESVTKKIDRELRRIKGMAGLLQVEDGLAVLIRKIDSHKRKAFLEMLIFGEG